MATGSSKPNQSIQRVIEVIRANGEVSRRLIASETGLSTPSVTRLVNELIDSNILAVHDSTTAEGAGPGRPASVVKLNPNCAYIVGVDVGEHVIQVALGDMSGRILLNSRLSTDAEKGGDATCSNIIKGIDEVCGLYKSSFDGVAPALRAITVGVPGTVDPASSRVAKAPMINGWSDFDLKGRLENRMPNIAWRIENDINLAAIGEFAYGVAQNCDNFVFASIRRGIGAGIFIDGKLYRGNAGFAGEIGKMAFDSSFKFSHAEGTGHLESLCGEDPVIAEAKQRGLELKPDDSGVPTMNSLAKAAASGDATANSILESILSHYGLAIANVASLLDPSMIVVGGRIHPVMATAVLHLNETVSGLIPSPPKVVGSSLGDQAILKGAVYQAHKDACDRLLIPQTV